MVNIRVKPGFHRPANINEINHRCIKISRQVVQTFRHRQMDIGAILAGDVAFLVKSKVLCTNELNNKYCPEAAL